MLCQSSVKRLIRVHHLSGLLCMPTLKSWAVIQQVSIADLSVKLSIHNSNLMFLCLTASNNLDERDTSIHTIYSIVTIFKSVSWFRNCNIRDYVFRHVPFCYPLSSLQYFTILTGISSLIKLRRFHFTSFCMFCRLWRRLINVYSAHTCLFYVAFPCQPPNSVLLYIWISPNTLFILC